jgi:uncharacterized protein (DUF58 family)
MGAYAKFESLLALEFKVRGSSPKHSQPLHSLLFGRHTSRVRGRGLDFEEIRNYIFGDDVRSIDWRVTARMRKPFVRVYTEERDRPTLLIVDQRINMFFGSRVSMKSVVAAEIAALIAWKVFRQGDRVGALVFNDSKTDEIPIRRSRANVVRVLERIANQNSELRGDSPVRARSDRLNDVIETAMRACRRDALVVIASDFDGADKKTRDLLLNFSQSNDLVCCLTYDPLAISLPGAQELVVSDGDLQIELELSKEQIRKSILDATDKRIRSILSWQHELGVPVLPVSTADDVPGQLRHFLAKVGARRRRM